MLTCSFTLPGSTYCAIRFLFGAVSCVTNHRMKEYGTTL
nr:MAG TPA: hypothetical protein [Caudoviricetes sp.]DAL52778.1 MAG TPA_asm: hypothetical protein [Caudoviricetes sp.]